MDEPSQSPLLDALSPSDVQHLNQALTEQSASQSFHSLLEGCIRVLADHGVDVDRLQIPMTNPFGFRHPTLWGVLLTWTRARQFEDTQVVTHAHATAIGLTGEDPIARAVLNRDNTPKNPFYFIHGQRDWFFECDMASPPVDFPLFEQLQAQGLQHYACFRLLTPATSTPFVVSLASARPFPNDLRQRLETLRGLVGVAFYASYRTTQATEIAMSYVGQRTGPKVLDGRVARGYCEEIRAGIMFCDVRGFTALSQAIGAEIIPVMNQIFEVIGEEAERRGGEILKFIGDAMLLIFPLEDGNDAAVARSMVETVEHARLRVADVAQQTGSAVSVGFGCHIGDVIYGNIGTPKRVDFTVMGPAVNLASRLESLCKPIGTSGVFSSTVQAHCDELVSAGAHALKGIVEPVPVWVVPD